MSRTLISADMFKAMARKGAKPSDFDGVAVFKAAALGLKADPDPNSFAVEFILSNANLDREGDSITVEGWTIDNYRKNPVVLWAHDHGGLPIARSAKTWTEGKNLKSIDDFTEAAGLYPFAATVHAMIRAGLLSAVSVGFQPEEWDQSDSGMKFLKQDLLEHSVCPVPAHPEALVVARSKGINVAPLKEWAERVLDLNQKTNLSPQLAAKAKAEIERLRVQADPTGRKLFQVLGDLKLPKAAPKSVEQVLVLDESPAGGTPKADPPPPAPPAPPAEPPAPESGYQTMATLLEGVTAPVMAAAEAIRVLANYTPDEPPATVREQLSAVRTNAAAAGEALANISTMAQSMIDELGEPEAEGEGENEPPPPPPPPPPDDSTREADPDDMEEDEEDEETKRSLARIVARAPAEPPLRWNRRLSKAFDVSRVQIDADTKEQALAAAYLNVELKHVEVRRQTVPTFRMGSWLMAIDQEVAQWQVDDIRNLTYEGTEMPPVYELIQLNSSLSSDFLVDGIRFMRQQLGDGKERRLVLCADPSWYGLELKFYGVRDTGEAGHTLAHVGTKAKSLNFLKGEAFALCGEFLPKTSETFESLFLDAKNQAAMQRIVRLINERGQDLENRGVLALGPPGTGKTLSARIMRNMATSTFIWVSSRDFSYAGAFGGITEAFDLARECAPSIIVFEDIDNWLSAHTLDLLKTELDGVGRSTGVVTMMTTNYPELLPAALLDRPGRFHDVLRFGLPDATVRRQMLAAWMPDLADADAVKVVAATDGYSGAHIRELARFASIIGEQDGVDLSTAVSRALAKLAEQRDLITATQTAGSRYRMPSEAVLKGHGPAPVLTKLKTVIEGLPALLHGKEVVVTGTQQRILDLKSIVTMLKAKTLSPEQLQAVDHADSLLSVPVVKMGRVLSAANEDRIRKAGSLLDEVLAQLQASDPMPDEEEDDEGEDKKHVFLLEEEEQIDVEGFDAAMVAAEVRDVLREELMRVTGRVID